MKIPQGPSHTTPSQTLLPQMVLRRECWPGGSGHKAKPLVVPGQHVLADQPILSIEALATSDRSGSASRTPTGGPAAMFPAGLRGRVIEITPRGGVVIESHVARLQGSLGAGKQVAGLIAFWQASDAAIPPGALLVVPGMLDFTLLHRAVASGVAGIIASSISLHDIEGFLRTDLIELLNGGDTAQLGFPPLTLLLTEGVGAANAPAHLLYTLSQYQGSIALLSGHTSLRQGIFPELLISLPSEEMRRDAQEQDTTLTLGSQVRVCSGQDRGTIGVIDYFFIYEQTFPSGLRTRAVRLRRPDGTVLTVPTMLLERIV